MSQLGTCEMTLDSSKNFTNYKATLAQVNPPCIPFIGKYALSLSASSYLTLYQVFTSQLLHSFKMVAKIHYQVILSTLVSVPGQQKSFARYSTGNRKISISPPCPPFSHSSKKRWAHSMKMSIGGNNFGTSVLNVNPESVKTRRWPDYCKRAGSCDIYFLVFPSFRSTLFGPRSFVSLFFLILFHSFYTYLSS